MTRPNILFITTDQHRADCHGFENPAVRTPHLDRLAASGTRFKACITPNLVCQPARASMLTGLLPLTNGVWDNGVDLDPAIGAAGFAGQLAAVGYHTGFIGKAHFSSKQTFQPTGSPECRYSSVDYPDDWCGPYMGFEHVELAVLGKFHRGRPPNRSPSGQHFERWFFDPRRGDDALRLWAESFAEDVGAAQTWRSKLPAAWHCTTWVADRAAEFLRRAPTNHPFCLWMSIPDPHHPFDCPAPWHDMYRPENIVLPKHRAPDLERRPWWHKAALEGTPQIADPALRKFRQENFKIPRQTDRQLAEMMSNYFGMISLADHNIGRVLTTLEDLGLDRNTIVVYANDHGDFLGEHGLYLKGPMPYESVLRVALLFAGPGIEGGRVVDEVVSTVDLAATLCDLAGAPGVNSAQSRSLKPLLEGGAQSRDYALSEWHIHPARLGLALQLRTVRTRRHKCTFELGSGAGELYDLQEDPFETVNRFDDPAYAAVRRELEGAIRDRPGPLRDNLAEPVGMA